MAVLGRLNGNNMANRHFEELINSAKPDRGARMGYDTGEAAGLYSRGNVLLGVGSFLKSFCPGLLDKITMNFLF